MASNYLISEVILDIRERLSEEVADFWEDAGLYRWIDQAQKKIQSDFPHLEQISTTDSITGQQNYELPEDYLMDGMRKVFYDGKRLEPKDFDTLLEEDSEALTGAGEVLNYFIYDGELYLVGTVEVGKEIKAYFYKVPDKITAPTQYLEVDDQYYEVVVKYVVEQALYKHEDYEGGMIFGDKADMQREDIKSNKLTRTKDKIITTQPPEPVSDMYRR